MKTSTKLILSLVLAAVIVGAIWYIVEPRHQLDQAVSPAGTLNSTAKIAQAIVNPSGSITSTTSYAAILNTDATDRIIRDVYYYFPATGVTNTFTVATSSASTGTPGTTLMSVTLSTSTNPSYLSSTTPGVTTSAANGAAFRVWASGSYLQFNSTATDTAAVGGIVGVVYALN